jgi:hypothetical protein
MADVFAIFTACYSRFYANSTEADIDFAIGVWHNVLRDYPGELVAEAARKVVRESPFPPTPADICRRVDAVSHAAKQVFINEAWAKLLKAARRGLYHADQDFPNLPEVCQRFVSSPNGITKLANTDEDKLEGEVQKAFREFAANDSAFNTAFASALPAASPRRLADGTA